MRIRHGRYDSGVPARRPSTLRSLDAALRRARADDRLDRTMGEAFATAARVSACEVDAACAPGSDVASYARGQVIAVHLRALKALDEHVRPVPDTDPWKRFLDDPEWRDYLAAADDPTAAVRAPFLIPIRTATQRQR